MYMLGSHETDAVLSSPAADQSLYTVVGALGVGAVVRSLVGYGVGSIVVGGRVGAATGGNVVVAGVGSGSAISVPSNSWNSHWFASRVASVPPITTDADSTESIPRLEVRVKTALLRLLTSEELNLSSVSPTLPSACKYNCEPTLRK